MKSILEYISDYYFNQSMITESFKSSILQEITKQFNDRIKSNAEYNKEKNWAYKDTKSTFKKLFSEENVKWSEITDDDFKEYEKEDEEGLKLAKRMVANRSNTFPGMVILLNNDQDNDSPKYIGAIIATGYTAGFVSFVSDWNFVIGWGTKPSDVRSLLTKKYLLIDLTNYKSSDLRHERINARQGAYLFSDDNERKDFYKNLAKQNVERYKRYIAKVKADKDSNDGYAEKVEEYSKKVLEFTIKVSKNPIKYASQSWEISSLLELLNDKKVYNNSRGRNPGYFSGTNGLLTVYKQYVDKKLSLSKGTSYEHETKEYEACKKELENIFQKIDNKLAKLDV